MGNGVQNGAAVLATVIAIGYLALASTTARSSVWYNFISYAPFVLLAAGLAAALWWAARQGPRDGYRRGFAAYSVSFAATALGSILWLIERYFWDADPTYSWPNLFYAVSYLAAFVGVLSFPTDPLERSGRIKLGLDVFVALVAGFAMTWVLTLPASFDPPPDSLKIAILLAFPILNFVIGACLVPRLLSAAGGPRGRALRRLAGGQLIYLAGDLGYQWRGSHPSSVSVEVFDLLYLVGYVVMISAAQRAWQHDQQSLAASELRRGPLPRNAVVWVVAVALYVVLIHTAWIGNLSAVATLTIAALLVTAAILIREAITERERVRLAHALGLERSQLRLQSVTEHLRVGVLIENFESGLRVANPAALELLELSEAAWQERGSSAVWDDVVDDLAQPLPQASQPLTIAREQCRPVHNQVVGLKHTASDQRRWLMFHIDVERSPTGSLRELACIVHDVTDRRLLEQRLRHSQRMEAVGRLASGVAHDFNNVLTAIGGCAQLAEERLSPGSAAGPYLREVRNAATRAGNLTRGLLSLGARESLKPTVLDLNQAIESSLRLLRQLLRENVALELHTTADLPHVRLDPGELERVIVNLVINARDAMPKGGRITIQTQLDPARNLEGSNQRRVAIRVSDTGVGMDESTRARAFDPFFTTKSAGAGSGLGLATVYSIVRQSGGEVSLESAPGRGTVVTIELPCAEIGSATESVSTAQPAMPSALAGHETVLIVEDDPQVRSVARRSLTRHGYKVLEAASAGEARPILEANSQEIDLLLSDVVMPGEGGFELARWAKQQLGLTHILLITGYSDDPLLPEQAKNAGMSLLTKPFLPDQLTLRVRELLDNPPTASSRGSSTSPASAPGFVRE